MKIENNARAVFEFAANDYFLVLSKEVGFSEKRWSLNYRIDRSYAGKDDDVGIAAVYLNENEAEQCKKAGFSFIELP